MMTLCYFVCFLIPSPTNLHWAVFSCKSFAIFCAHHSLATVLKSEDSSTDFHFLQLIRSDRFNAIANKGICFQNHPFFLSVCAFCSQFNWFFCVLVYSTRVHVLPSLSHSLSLSASGELFQCYASLWTVFQFHLEWMWTIEMSLECFPKTEMVWYFQGISITNWSFVSKHWWLATNIIGLMSILKSITIDSTSWN